MILAQVDPGTSLSLIERGGVIAVLLIVVSVLAWILIRGNLVPRSSVERDTERVRAECQLRVELTERIWSERFDDERRRAGEWQELALEFRPMLERAVNLAERRHEVNHHG